MAKRKTLLVIKGRPFQVLGALGLLMATYGQQTPLRIVKGGK